MSTQNNAKENSKRALDDMCNMVHECISMGMSRMIRETRSIAVEKNLPPKYMDKGVEHIQEALHKDVDEVLSVIREGFLNTIPYLATTSTTGFIGSGDTVEDMETDDVSQLDETIEQLTQDIQQEKDRICENKAKMKTLDKETKQADAVIDHHLERTRKLEDAKKKMFGCGLQQASERIQTVIPLIQETDRLCRQLSESCQESGPTTSEWAQCQTTLKDYCSVNLDI